MAKIIITTESSADLKKEWIEQYNIKTVPFSVNFPDRSLFDNEFPVREIYDFYEKTGQIPKTNAVNPDQYTQFFERIAAENPGCVIIHMGYSSVCSCSFQNAIIGEADCEHAKVYLIDSKNVSGGLGNLVIKAAEIAEANPDMDPEALVQKIVPYVKKTHTAFVPNKLDFLAAGGRVSNAAALGAALLRLKPRIDILDGALIAGKKYVGVMKRIIPEFVHDFVKDKNLDKSLVYAFCSEEADEEAMKRLVECLKKEGFERVETSTLGCVMTVHGGKGAMGISAMDAE